MHNILYCLTTVPHYHFSVVLYSMVLYFTVYRYEHLNVIGSIGEASQKKAENEVVESDLTGATRMPDVTKHIETEQKKMKQACDVFF